MKDVDGDLVTCRYGSGRYESNNVQSAYAYISSNPYSSLTVLMITILRIDNSPYGYADPACLKSVPPFKI